MPVAFPAAARPALAGPSFGALASILMLGMQPAVRAQEPAPPAGWSLTAARGLLKAIEASAAEGLNPADYDPEALRQAIAGGEGPGLDGVADSAGMAIARDYFLGRVRDRAAFDWHIERSPYEAFALGEGLHKAVATGDVEAWLAGLLPKAPQYRALRDALPAAHDPAEIERLRANMERWRWLPRTLGDDYLLVNVPSYTLRVVRGGVEEARYDVVVGAPKTPTPAIVAPAGQVVVNPWWTLPPSVLAEGGSYPAARGFVRVRAASGETMIRQRPGPQNALGRIKIDMPNPQAIYLHDTPAKAAFARKDRALSHGCIRVRGIAQLAASLQDDGAVAAALDGDATTAIALSRPLPVYIVYMTAEAKDGRVASLPDIYRRDERLVAMMDSATKRASSGPILASRDGTGAAMGSN
ncbi:L,D-transpeptidase family protein [Sphingomonas quercus]|uniref:L,D-transpeptidase family protein n=1 Tax=Sphingomonas quercus TaxID=2842451 RepID=A0ABS6BFF2_9SPHN|nr:L,D-transpeptidase family protein [Sphingomonas quercus]MBU3076556.1 L,D-transpeptidase family protein [Sphingomonas quercus]